MLDTIIKYLRELKFAVLNIFSGVNGLKTDTANLAQINTHIDFYVNTYLPNNGNLLTSDGQWLTDGNGNFLTFNN